MSIKKIDEKKLLMLLTIFLIVKIKVLNQLMKIIEVAIYYLPEL